MDLLEEFKQIENLVVILKVPVMWTVYAKDVAARDVLLSWLRHHDCQIEQKRDRQGEPINAWLITLSPEVSQALTHRHDSIMVNELHLTEAWHWAPLARSADLYKRILAAAMVVDRVNYYPKHNLDNRVDIYDHQRSAISLFVRHFTAIPADEWRTFVRQCLDDKAWTCGARFVPRLAKFCGAEELEVRGHPLDGALAVAKLATGGNLSTEEVEAARHAAEEPGDRETIRKMFNA